MSHGHDYPPPLPGKPGGIQVDRVNRALDMEGVEGAWEGQVRDVLIRESDDPQAAALELEDAACGPFRRGSAAGVHDVGGEVGEVGEGDERSAKVGLPLIEVVVAQSIGAKAHEVHHLDGWSIAEEARDGR